MSYELVFCGVLCLLFGQMVTGQRTCKDESTFVVNDSDLGTDEATFECPNGYIVSMDVTGVKGDCSGTSSYTRRIGRECMWLSRCTIPNRTPGKLTLTEDRCVQEVPDQLEVTYTCSKDKVKVVDVKAQNTQQIHAAEGILHTDITSINFPSRSPYVVLMNPEDNTTSPLTITVRHFAPGAGIEVKMYQYRFNPDSMETLQITSEDVEVTMLEAKDPVVHFSKDLKKTALLTPADDKGFMLCFQWTNSVSKEGCDGMTSQAQCSQ